MVMKGAKDGQDAPAPVLDECLFQISFVLLRQFKMTCMQLCFEGYFFLRIDLCNCCNDVVMNSSYLQIGEFH